MPRIGLLAVLLCAPCSLLSTQASPYTPPQLPPPHGFRVFIVPDMEGMGSAVDIHERPQVSAEPLARRAAFDSLDAAGRNYVPSKRERVMRG